MVTSRINWLEAIRKRLDSGYGGYDQSVAGGKMLDDIDFLVAWVERATRLLRDYPGIFDNDTELFAWEKRVHTLFSEEDKPPTIAEIMADLEAKAKQVIEARSHPSKMDDLFARVIYAPERIIALITYVRKLEQLKKHYDEVVWPAWEALNKNLRDG